MRPILIILLLLSLGNSRDDPFKPFSYKSKNDSNSKIYAKIEFPDNAKKINKVIFEYETNDGTKTYINKRIDKKIDPNKVLIIRQSKERKVGFVMDLDDDILADLELDDSEFEVIKQNDFYSEIRKKRRDDPFTNITEDKPKKTNSKIEKGEDFIRHVEFYDFISIDLYKKKFVIICDNKIKKQFMINGENKIVIDFKHSIEANSKRKNIFKPPYKYIDVGIHSNYYRVVMKLDRLKKFTLKHTDLGYEVKF